MNPLFQQDLNVLPSRALKGEITVPGDKSISHRALILGALAQGQTVIHNLLRAGDCESTLNIFRELGVTFDIAPDRVIVNGVGLHGLQPSREPLDCGNSGTTMRLLAGVLAGQPFHSVLTGDSSLLKRPMARIMTPLMDMGARLSFPPLHIEGNARLRGIHYHLPIASAQVKSCLLLASLFAEGEMTVTGGEGARDHTERLFQYLNIRSGQPFAAKPLTVPGDLSSAAFFIVGAAMSPGSHVLIRGVGVNPTRTGVLTILRKMGAFVQLRNLRDCGNEPVADIEVEGTQLRGVTVDPQDVVGAIDEFPALFVAMACAQGESLVRGVSELRVKECDRIAVMAAGLQQLGIQVQELPDSIGIVGGQIRGGEVECAGDHRIAMAFAIAGICAKASITIRDCANIATSFPNFTELAQQIGLNLCVSQLSPSTVPAVPAKAH